MREIAPGIFHWSTYHEGIGARVSSCYLEAERTLIDPRVPDEGLDWFRHRARPAHVLLTNRHHYRHSGQFVNEFGAETWCHEAGLHEFTSGERVRAFRHGDRLFEGIVAVAIGSLCPEETAFHVPARRAVALGDSLVRRDFDGALAFVPDAFMGDDPEEVKRGLRAAFADLLELEWEHLLLAHARPIVGKGKQELTRFLARAEKRRAA